MAENVMVDEEAGVAHWFDFETTHEPGRPGSWQRADDLRALIATSLLRTDPDERAATLALMLDAYGDEDVERTLASGFASGWRRPLTYHLGQASLSLRDYREIGRLLRQRAGDWPVI